MDPTVLTAYRENCRRPVTHSLLVSVFPPGQQLCQGKKLPVRFQRRKVLQILPHDVSAEQGSSGMLLSRVPAGGLDYFPFSGIAVGSYVSCNYNVFIPVHNFAFSKEYELVVLPALKGTKWFSPAEQYCKVVSQMYASG